MLGCGEIRSSPSLPAHLRQLQVWGQTDWQQACWQTQWQAFCPPGWAGVRRDAVQERPQACVQVLPTIAPKPPAPA